MSFFSKLFGIKSSRSSGGGSRRLRLPFPLMTCYVKADTSSMAWRRTVRKVLQNTRGVWRFRMDEFGMVRVLGTVDPQRIITKLAKKGNRATLLYYSYGDSFSYADVSGGGCNIPPGTKEIADIYVQREAIYYCGGGYGGSTCVGNCTEGYRYYRPFASLFQEVSHGGAAVLGTQHN